MTSLLEDMRRAFCEEESTNQHVRAHEVQVRTYGHIGYRHTSIRGLDLLLVVAQPCCGIYILLHRGRSVCLHWIGHEVPSPYTAHPSLTEEGRVSRKRMSTLLVTDHP